MSQCKTFRYKGYLCEVFKHIRERNRWCGRIEGKNKPFITDCRVFRDGVQVLGTPPMPSTEAQARDRLKFLVDDIARTRA